MADVKISALGAISSVAGEDLVAIVDDPSGTPASRKATIDQIKTYIGGMTASSTATFTNKTFDAEGTGNSISNIDVANLKSGVLDTDISTTSSSDDTIPSAKAVKTAIDAKASTVSELTDTTITSIGDNELLQYDSTSSKWINQTLTEAGILSNSLTSTQIIVGNGSNIATGVALSGDATITNAGAIAVSDLTISGETAQDLLYYTGSAWARLAKGSDGQVLKTDSGSLAWGAGGGGDHTEQGFDVYTTHTPTATTSDGIAYMFARKIDSNNDGLYITLWKNGASQEVQIA
jgi:hypothetical protein